MWREGIVQGPDGEARQIPRAFEWKDTLWVTRDGAVRRRFWDLVGQHWRWDDEPLALTMEEPTGRMGVWLQPWFTTIEMCIGLAWLKRAEQSTAPIELEEGRPLEKRYLRWEDGGEPYIAEPTRIDGETWKDLRWRCGCVPVPEGYQLSSRARLRAPSGEITRGYAFGDTRLAAIRNAGLVDLQAAAGLRRDIKVPPRIYTTINALQTGHTPSEIAEALEIKEDAAWSYTYDAGKVMPTARLWNIARAIVSRDLLELLVDMRSHDDPLLDGRASDLMAEAEDSLDQDGDFLMSECRFGQIRFARMALAARG